jgi:hypothetical protein
LDVFSPWALHPGLDVVKIALEVGAVLLAAALAFATRERTLAQMAALAGALTIAIQLPAVHWFYYYILWFLPFVLVGLLVPQRTSQPEASDQEPDAGPLTIEDHRSEPERVLVGA